MLDGSPTVACNTCNTWQHIGCLPEKIASLSENEDFICASCADTV